eukprot:4241274-Amphidinium_carterae.1
MSGASWASCAEVSETDPTSWHPSMGKVVPDCVLRKVMVACLTSQPRSTTPSSPAPPNSGNNFGWCLPGAQTLEICDQPAGHALFPQEPQELLGEG